MFSHSIIPLSLALIASASSHAQEAMRVTQDSPRAVLDRYVEAIGGRANLERIHTRITQSSMSIGFGMNADVETAQERPDRVVSRAKVKMLGKVVAEFSSGYDGSVAWSLTKEEGVRSLEGVEAQQLVLDSRLDRDARLAELYPAVTALPDRVIDGRNHHVLEMSTTFGTREVWFFDAASGLLTRTELVKEDPKKGRVQVTNTFRDYRDVDGVRIPFRTDVEEGKDRFTIKTKSVRHNVAVEADAFARPR